MALIELAGNEYESYASIEAADIYLAADANLFALWAAAPTDTKARALITSTRYLQTLGWCDGVPSIDDVNPIVLQSTVLLSAKVAQTPGFIESLGSGDNIRRVRAGSAEVEFFQATIAQALPTQILRQLSGMLSGQFGPSGTDGADSATLAAIGSPHDGGANADVCPQACEYGLTKPYA